jgi:lipoprotein-releasing system permease protein
MAFAPFEWMLAMRYLRARRQDGLISVIAAFSLMGIALGVATLIVVMSVMNGFRAELLGRILGLNGHITIQATDGPTRDFDALAAELAKRPGVRLVAPLIDAQVMATGNGTAAGALVRGIRPEALDADGIVAKGLIDGTLADFKGDDAAVVGDRLARKLGLRLGDTIALISPEGTPTAFGTIARTRSYRIVALFDVGMYEYDSSFVFLPLEQAQIHFRMKDAVTALDLRIAAPDQAPALRRELQAALGPEYRVLDWQQTNAHFFNALQVERNVMFLILTLIIVVAAFNIVSSMIMLVKDKGRDIAILRTMGVTAGSVMRIFFIAGASIGVAGTFLGFLLGLGFASNVDTIRGWLENLTGTRLFAAEIYFLSKLPAKIDSGEVITVVVMALGLAFLATLYPAWRAARLDPVEALRYE